ncbi:MAG: HpaII family restriction endonuclease [Selenomonadaceae bacterium]|nr:HpaII family restriction endonuclease [Selenomonadaceae bacterium]
MYKMIDLFAGIGGIRLGFEYVFGADAATVFVSEIDKYARTTYAENFPDDVPIDGDITQIPAEEIPPFDICLAGFPCQAFSIAGKRGGFDDDYHGTCRGTLFLDVIRICDYHKPKIIFCENVKGLVNHDKGRTFKIICNAFEQIGYKIFYKVLNSRDFGLAQNRERIYIVCFRNDIAPENFNFPTPIDERCSIRDILEYAPIASKYYLSDVYLETLRKHRQRHEAAGNGFGYEVKDLDGVANALVCGGMGRERNLIVDEREHSKIPTTKIHGEINEENIRKLTPREWARLQGFSDEFRFVLPDTQLYKQFGNTVSIDVVAAIAQEIRSVLEPMTYNKGEWSELYALLKLLADGKINAEVNGEQIWLPVLKIFREDVAGFKLEFRRQKDFVERYQNGDRVWKIKASEFAAAAEKILCGIKNSGGGKITFEIDGAEEIMRQLGLTKIKSPADKKADIELEIHDTFTGADFVRGYSIKSDLGSAPTLFNASKTTNFRFKIFGVDDVLAEKINSINTRKKIQDRLKKIPQLEFDSVCKKIFADNLSLVDSNMEKILGEMLKIYYVERIADCAELVTELEKRNPLKIGVENYYRHKIKKFLCAVALGLKPATKWNGLDEANGGYLIVQNTGELVIFPLHNRDDFETYLLNNTRLETPSTNRFNFATIFSGGGAKIYRPQPANSFQVKKFSLPNVERDFFNSQLQIPNS